MSTTKEHIIDMIQYLPEDITTEDFLYELYFKLQVEIGLRELEEGKGIPHEEVKEKLAKWLH